MSTLLAGLVDDAAVFPPGDAAVAEAVEAHRELRLGPYASAVGPLLVRAQQVAELVGAARAGDDLRVGLVASPAGGLVELAYARDVLLDLEDAAALVQVEVALPPDIDPATPPQALLDGLAFSAQAYVEVPRWPGGEGALDVLAADGVERAKFRTGGTTPAGASVGAGAGRLRARLRRPRPGVQAHGRAAPRGPLARPPRASSSTGCSTCWPRSRWPRTAPKPDDLAVVLATRDPAPLLEVLAERRPQAHPAVVRLASGAAASPNPSTSWRRSASPMEADA